MSKEQRDVRPYTGVIEWNNHEWWWHHENIKPDTWAEFTATVTVNAINKAWIALTSDSLYSLWINDIFIVNGPLREVPPYLYYDAIDIAAFLQAGKNTMRILVHYNGENNGSYVAHQAGLAVQGLIQTTEQSQTIDLADKNLWQVAQPPCHLPAQRLGGCIGFAEHTRFPYVAAVETGVAKVCGQVPLKGREEILVRDLPFFCGKKYYGQVLQDKIFDLQQEVFGFVELDFSLAEHTIFEIHYAEHLTDGVVNSSKQGMAYFDTIEAAPGRFQWRSFDKRAMRFISINHGPVEIHSIAIQEYLYPYPEADCSSETELDRQIKEISARTIALCSDDLLNDCPWRERAQYLDPFFYFEAMQKLFGTLEPARRYIRQFMRSANADGLLRMSYPSPPSASIIPDFALSFPLVLQHYYELSADLK
ncbi:MAG: hypothetical protein HRU15_05580, partial [Planctomycetes bacterium]|nr:hypothetical protein [Planctomycetota bacterium]